MTDQDITRFWQKVRRTDNCWEWTASLDGRGYGKFATWSGSRHKYHIASRVSWILENGEVPAGMNVCHKCDNRKCVRPDHLFLGTTQDNSDDMVTKGRHEFRVGENNPRARLSWDDVSNIRERRSLGVPLDILAEEFGVTKGHVYNLCDPNQNLWTGRRRSTKREIK